MLKKKHPICYEVAHLIVQKGNLSKITTYAMIKRTGTELQI
jgi:hypothetical protein